MNKWLVSMSAAAVAAGAMAVESQNVVGVQDVVSPTFQLITPMFTQVGGGTSFTLANFVPADLDTWEPGSDKIILYTGANKDYSATYLTAELLAELAVDFPKLAGLPAGWYDYDQINELDENTVLTCYNSRSIGYGASGFAIQSQTAIRFIGEVKATDTPAQSSTFQLVGNCTPVDLTLAQIVPANLETWEPGSDKIILYTGANKDYSATYLTAELLAELAVDFPKLAGLPAGWYDYDQINELDENTVLTCYNSRSIPAGTGFAIQANTAVKIPAPEL